MNYENGKLHINSDFEIRMIREVKNDFDLLIPIENRTLNVYLDSIDLLHSRLQFPMIKGIMIRFSSLENINIATIHLLRNIDLQSAIVNFEINYEQYFLELKDKEYFVEMRFVKKNICNN